MPRGVDGRTLSCTDTCICPTQSHGRRWECTVRRNRQEEVNDNNKVAVSQEVLAWRHKWEAVEEMTTRGRRRTISDSAQSCWSPTARGRKMMMNISSDTQLLTIITPRDMWHVELEQSMNWSTDWGEFICNHSLIRTTVFTHFYFIKICAAWQQSWDISWFLSEAAHSWCSFKQVPKQTCHIQWFLLLQLWDLPFYDQINNLQIDW